MVVETRYLRNALSESKVYPSSYNIIKGSLTSGSLSDLQSSNDVYMVFASEAIDTSEQRVEVEFSGTHSGHMPFLQVLIEAHASQSVQYEVSVYNYETEQYETSGTMYYYASLGTSDSEAYLYCTTGCRKYRSSGGEYKIKVKAITTGSPAPSFSLYIDYLHYRTVAFQLGTTQTTTSRGNDTNILGEIIGIRVWKVNADDTETELTPGSIVATVTAPSSTTILSNTWDCPSATNVVAIVVRVYTTTILKTADLSSGGLPLTFITEDINGTLNASTWTVYYAFDYISFTRETYFRFGDSTYNSRIENFSWTVVIVPKRIMGDGLVWIIV